MNPGKFAPLVFRQVVRNRRRTVLTFLGLVVAFFLFTSLQSVLYTLRNVLTRTGSDAVLYTRPRYGTPFWQAELPRSYLPKVRAVPGIVQATPYQFFIGQGAREGDFTIALGVDPDTIREVREIKGVSESVFSRFRADRTGAIVGERTAIQNKWKVGDEVTIRGVGQSPRSLSVRVVALTDEDGSFGRVVIAHLDYLEDVVGQQGKLTFIVSKAESVDIAAQAQAAIDESFRNFTVPTETVSEKAHMTTILGGLSDTLVALEVIGYLALAATILVVANTVAMGIRERTREIGTMRAVGYGARMVLAFVLSEAVLLAVTGAVAGSALAFGLFEGEIIKLPAEVGMPLRTTWTLIVRSTLLGFPMGILAGIQPALAAARMPITEALRYAD